MTPIITIDGPGGAGKSTIARLLAKKINFLYLDTGAMYRAVALCATRKGVDFSNIRKLNELLGALILRFDTSEHPPRLFMNNEDISEAIRHPEIDLLSSKISAVNEVRQAMTRLQQEMAIGNKLVAEGRDMGTVVFPDAPLKFFLTASPETRAERRYQERVDRGENITRQHVEADLKKRDHQDRTRSLAPLKAASDAIVIDSTPLTPNEVIENMMGHMAIYSEYLTFH